MTHKTLPDQVPALARIEVLADDAIQLAQQIKQAVANLRQQDERHDPAE